VSIPSRGVLGSLVAALAFLVTAGCSGNGVYATTQVPATTAPSSASAPSATATPPPPTCGNPLASFAPAGPNPAPGASMPAGSWMATI
jgi:hypothetical protein